MNKYSIEYSVDHEPEKPLVMYAKGTLTVMRMAYAWFVRADVTPTHVLVRAFDS